LYIYKKKICPINIQKKLESINKKYINTKNKLIGGTNTTLNEEEMLCERFQNIDNTLPLPETNFTTTDDLLSVFESDIILTFREFLIDRAKVLQLIDDNGCFERVFDIILIKKSNNTIECSITEPNRNVLNRTNSDVEVANRMKKSKIFIDSLKNNSEKRTPLLEIKQKI